MASTRSRPLVSLVIPCYNESEVFPDLEAALVSLADSLRTEFDIEIVLVDDGSTDTTWPQIEAFCARDGRARGIALSRNFGHQVALTCGYDSAKGDAVISMDADLQDPPEAVREMLEKWKAGYDLVDAVRSRREGETRLKLWTASLFYATIRLLGARHVKTEAGDFRLISRRALDALGRMREHHRFIRGMTGWVGFRTTDIFFRRKPRKAGKTKNPMGKMLRLACDGIVSFSTAPLRLSLAAALLVSLWIVADLAFAAVRHWCFGAEMAPGWSGLLLAVAALGVMNLLCLGILGEYVGRIYEQVKQRPLYFVRETTPPAVPPPPSPG